MIELECDRTTVGEDILKIVTTSNDHKLRDQCHQFIHA